MDNLTHSLAGAALAKTRLGELSPFAAPAMIVCANLPDADLAARLWGGPEAYLTDHRGITHSLLGVALLSLVCGAILRALERRFAPGRGAGFAGAWLVCFAALASHPALDWLNNYGLRPWLPFDATWTYGDMAFIVDPWMWLLFGGAAALAGERTRRGSLLLGAVGVGASALWFLNGRTPQGMFAWPVLALAIAAARVLGVGRAHPRRVLATFAVATAAYLGLLAVQSHRALERGRAIFTSTLGPEEPIERLGANPHPADPWHWSVLALTPLSVWTIDLPDDGSALLLQRLDRRLDDPRVRAAVDSACASAWRSFARFPHAGVVVAPDGADVHLMDARYQTAPGRQRYLGGSATARPGPTWSSALVHFDAQGRIEGCER